MKRSDENFGFSLVEMMISISILTFVMAAVINLIDQTQDTFSDTRITEVRDEIAREIEATLRNISRIQYAAYNDTAIGNAKLAACLKAGDSSGARNCTSTNPRNQDSFFLSVKRGATRRPLAGTEASPVYYNKKGELCPSSNTSCRFWRAVTYFYANCYGPNGVSDTTCDQAGTIYFRYQVKPLNPPRKMRTIISARPPDPDFKSNPTLFSISHRLRGIQNLQTCPLNSKVTGYGTNGRILCDCLDGSSPSSYTADGFPICLAPRGVVCPDGEVLVGLKQGTRLPDCKRPQIQCDSISTSGGDQAVNCPTGSWLTSFSMADCVPAAQDAKSKADSRPITCGTSRGTCCHYEI